MTSLDTRSERARAAAAARALAAGSLTWEAFVDEFGDAADPRVAELVDLIEREPEVGGFLGVSPRQYRSYRATIERLISELERDP